MALSPDNGRHNGYFETPINFYFELLGPRAKNKFCPWTSSTSTPNQENTGFILLLYTPTYVVLEKSKKFLLTNQNDKRPHIIQ